MEQKDYLMREIEKLGLVLSAIRQKLFGGPDNLAISVDERQAEAKGMLLDKLNFDLEKFLSLNKENSIQYLNSFEGLNTENLETLAECLSELGLDGREAASGYLNKALLIYEHCNHTSATFSFERESKIAAICKKMSL